MRDARATALLAALGAFAAAACRTDTPTAPSPRFAAVKSTRPCNGSSQCTLVFTVQPSATRATVTIVPPVEVTLVDPSGNPVTSFTGRVTIAIGTNPSGGTLGGTRAVRAVAGVARFSDLSIDRPGVGYTLVATAGGMTPGQSAPFSIFGPPVRLGFTGQPSNTTAGSSIAPAVLVTVLDANGITVADFFGSITISITPGSGQPGAILSGSRTISASRGVARFADLSIDKSGSGYTLTASSAALFSATSAAFAILPGAAVQLVFLVQPSDTVAGAPIPPFQVAAVDALGNISTSFSGIVTIAIGTNPSAGTLSGTFNVVAFAGIATFDDLKINLAGNGYTLDAFSAGLIGVTSTAFNII